MGELDIRKFPVQNLKELNSAVSRAAQKLRFWYDVEAWRFSVNLNEIAEQTGATSDYDKSEGKGFLSRDVYNSKKTDLIFSEKFGSNIRRLFRSTGICIYNPSNPLPEIKVGGKSARLTQIDGLSLANVFCAGVYFRRSIAFLEEGDQDIAHRLGLMYTPAGIIETDSLSCSDFEMHKGKLKIDDNGDRMLYCDNRACQKRVRNPVLVVDRQTGGLYHSEFCLKKDMHVKVHLARERGFKIEPAPEEVTLEDALLMYSYDELQQSEKPKFNLKFRSLKPWPEAARLFI